MNSHNLFPCPQSLQNLLQKNSPQQQLMNKTHVLKNQKDNKLKKIHMKSILCEVKNKSIIQDLENIRKCNEMVILNYKPNWKEWEVPRLSKKNSAGTMRENSNSCKDKTNGEILEDQQQNRSSIPDQQSKTGDQTQTIEPSSSRRRLGIKRKSSRIELQLKQIVQYSMMYPSRNNSQKKIDARIQRLINNDLSNVSKEKSRFSVIPGNTIRRRYTHKETQKVREEMMLNLVSGTSIPYNKQEAMRSKNTKYLLQKSKLAVLKGKPEFDFSLVNFIKYDMERLKIQQGNMTEPIYPQNQHQGGKGYDIREQSMINLHRFIRGQPKTDQQISHYLTTKEMNKFQDKYDIYDRIYRRTKDGFNNQKYDLNNMDELTVKNAVFLNEAHIQCNNRSRRQEIQKVMAKLNLYT